ncbi:MAG: cyclic nucleotide-binding domain-containing protein, partial [Prochlorococcaceae cyanobacterium]
MPATDPPAASSLPGLDGLGEGLRERLLASGERRLYGLGQSLCHADLIPSEILLLLSGSARLLARDAGVLRTAEKLGPGAWVGLASLLRAAPCEEVAAAGEVEVLAIADARLLALLKEEPAFAGWCADRLFSAELLALLAELLQRRAQADVSLLGLWRDLAPEARLVPPTREGLQSLTPGELLFAASHNLQDHPLGSELQPAEGVPKVRPPLPPRLIALPAAPLRAVLA